MLVEVLPDRVEPRTAPFEPVAQRVPTVQVELFEERWFVAGASAELGEPAEPRHVGSPLQRPVPGDAESADAGEELEEALAELKKRSRLPLLELVRVVQKQPP